MLDRYLLRTFFCNMCMKMFVLCLSGVLCSNKVSWCGSAASESSHDKKTPRQWSAITACWLVTELTALSDVFALDAINTQNSLPLSINLSSLVSFRRTSRNVDICDWLLFPLICQQLYVSISQYVCIFYGSCQLLHCLAVLVNTAFMTYQQHM